MAKHRAEGEPARVKIYDSQRERMINAVMDAAVTYQAGRSMGPRDHARRAVNAVLRELGVEDEAHFHIQNGVVQLIKNTQDYQYPQPHRGFPINPPRYGDH